MAWYNDLHKKCCVLQWKSQYFYRRIRVHQAQNRRTYNNSCQCPTREVHTSNRTTHHKHVLVGDINAHKTSWGSNRTNDMGEVVEDLLDKGYVLLKDGKASHSKGKMLDFHLGNSSIAKWTGFIQETNKTAHGMLQDSLREHTHIAPPQPTNYPEPSSENSLGQTTLDKDRRSTQRNQEPPSCRFPKETTGNT